MRKINDKKASNIFQYTALIVILLLSVIPLVMMITLSLRDTSSIYANFYGFEWPPKFGNYTTAMLQLIGPAMRTMFISTVSLTTIVVLASAAAYAFAKLNFPGKGWIFVLVISLLMIPQLILMTPNFILAKQLNLVNNLLGISLFYIAAAQPFAILVMRTFINSLPDSMFENARIEGAGELRCLFRLTLPLMKPVIVTVVLMRFIAIYNDLMWPMLVLSDKSKETLMVALQNYNPVASELVSSRPDIGVQLAGYAFASIPMLIIMLSGMKYYVQGITMGSVKG